MSSRRRVYFVEAGKGGPIKIGVALDVAARLKDLQASNPIRLRLIVSIPGDYDDECVLHRRFEDERLHGEWFRGDGIVRAFALSLIGMAPEESLVAIKRNRPEPKERPRGRRRYSLEEWRELIFVGNGDIYRSAEAEAVLAERERGRR